MKTVLEFNHLDSKQNEAHELVDRALSDGALMVQQTAMSLVAVDTGRLRASISVHRIGNLLWEVFTVVEYAEAQEYGTIYQTGTPYFRPAYERNYQQIIALMASRLKAL